MKVLIIEDDARLAASLRQIMTEEGHSADLCSTGQQGVAQANAGIYNAVILDWMLPDIDGPTVSERLRKAGCYVPILMLTARAELADRVLGLRSGADDYLAKPFEVEELLARLHALVRRADVSTLRVGELSLDRLSRRISVSGTPVDLTAREFALLFELASHPGKPVSRTRLISSVWGLNFDPGTNMLEVYISRVREKLGAHAGLIETVRGVGYCLRIDTKS